VCVLSLEFHHATENIFVVQQIYIIKKKNLICAIHTHLKKPTYQLIRPIAKPKYEH
jgi:hypothetical protein